ncbi:MAG: universal stress protein, partial [Desulfohalobiaceae bacterium]|nr:universal stress protein [Desulfohalobiaceae bacterium]
MIFATSGFASGLVLGYALLSEAQQAAGRTESKRLEQKIGAPMHKEIVLAVNPADKNDAPAEAAIGLAREHNAALVITYVHNPFFAELSMRERSSTHLKKMGRIKEDLQRKYARKTQGLRQCSYFVVQGDPATEILRIARMVRADLIVLGPHPVKYEKKRSRARRLHKPEPRVSTMERVAQLADCPVMVVANTVADMQLQYTHVVAATDFSPHAEHALRYAAQLAGMYKAKLQILNVLETGALGSQ